MALVYPPFGSKAVPPLGLSILSAGLKQLGFDSRVFYWNLEVIADLGDGDLSKRMYTYERLSRTGFFPQNEWIFVKEVFPDHRTVEETDLRHLDELDERFGYGKHRWRSKSFGVPPLLARRPSELTLRMRERASGLVEGMAEKLCGYDVIGINSTFFQNFAALALARRIKLQWPDKIVVMGGANCDGELGRSLMEVFPFLDFAFSGEVDFSFPDFVLRLSKRLPVDQVPGIIFRNERGTVVSGPQAMPIQDLDGLPIPDFDDYVATRERLGLNRNRDFMLAVESSRGCWWGARQHCTFCGLNALGMGYREKSQDRFQVEVEQLVERYGIRYLAVTDNILSMSYFRQFMKWAKQRELGINLFWEVKANLNRQQVKSLTEAGINWVQPGIESFSSDVLRLMRKGVKGIQNVALLKYAQEHGLVTSYFILYGFPGEAPVEYDKMRRNVRNLVHLQPPRGVHEIEYDRFSPYHQDPASFGLHLKPKSKYRLLYPFDDETISHLVYFFEREDTPKFPYVKRLKREVHRWHRVAQLSASQRPLLIWTPQGADILIDDRRPGFPRRRYRLQNYAVEVFHALDRPTTLQAVVRTSVERPLLSSDPTTAASCYESRSARKQGSASDRSPGSRLRWRALIRSLARVRFGTERVISFTRDEFDTRPARLLKPLVRAGIVYVEDDWWLALPVAAAASPPVRWQMVTPPD